MNNKIQVDPCIYREIFSEKFIKSLNGLSINTLFQMFSGIN